MLAFIILAILLLGAVSFGLLFLIFKLIWILCKNKRNFWPLILSAVLSTILMLTAAFFSYSVYQKYVKPFDPIIQTAKTQKSLQIGSRLYTNPVGFALTLHDGTTMSNWIKVEDWNFLVGLDTNIFVNKEKKNQPFSFYLLGHETDDDPQNVHKIMEDITQALSSYDSSEGKIEIKQAQPIDVGSNTIGEILTADIYPLDQTPPLTFSLVMATKGYNTYFLVGVGNLGNEKVLDTVSSFVITK